MIRLLGLGVSIALGAVVVTTNGVSPKNAQTINLQGSVTTSFDGGVFSFQGGGGATITCGANEFVNVMDGGYAACAMPDVTGDAGFIVMCVGAIECFTDGGVGFIYFDGGVGPQGETGPQGPTGPGCTTVEGDGGAFINCGDGGSSYLPPGPTGATGATGATGPEGPIGPGCSSVEGDGGVFVNCGDGGSSYLPPGPTGATGASGVGWTTVLDIDFTALSYQALDAGDTTYSIGGETWTKINSAGERQSAEITNDGGGLTIYPAQSTDYSGASRTLPAFTIPLSDLIPGFDPFTPVRVQMRISHNPTANYDSTRVAFERATSKTWFSFMRLYYNAVGTAAVTNLNSSSAGTSVNTGAPYSTDEVVVIELPSGVFSFHANYMSGGYDGGYPEYVKLNSNAIYLGTGAAVVSYLGTAENWSLLIGASRVGSATTGYTSHILGLKLEYRP